MTENDKNILEKAEKLTCIDWGEAEALSKLADSSEVKEELRLLSNTLYHKEEYFAGLL